VDAVVSKEVASFPGVDAELATAPGSTARSGAVDPQRLTATIGVDEVSENVHSDDSGPALQKHSDREADRREASKSERRG
jgi:hypothetical protein